jgi:hypothetical protein
MRDRCAEQPDLLPKREMSILPYNGSNVSLARMLEAENEWREITSMFLE